MALPLLLAAALLPDAPTLTEVEALPPASAGERLLQGRDHGPIVATVRKPQRGLDPPGVTEFELVEEARLMAGGCFRHLWTARFADVPGAPDAGALFRDAISRPQVALRVRGRCPQAGYAFLQPDVEPGQALRLLRLLRRIATGSLRVAFSCHSGVDPGLCTSDHTIRAGLRAAPAWAVSLSSGTGELWLGVPGQVVTIVTFAADRPNHVSVDKRIPAPF